ncbi:glutamate receptor ionotropic, delta-1 [Caerostris extrusa]|uniref:Glutamate receptor ionotropic, delta-1 n=1 Tax=Caerostris extrusa TaxID=172846 RepID=A0AAV4XGF2_CAEEX|nr:glutamate receptor ionotropic, delta-1 [Caerostris extrusa]
MERKTIVAIRPMEYLMTFNKSESGTVNLNGSEGKFLQIVLEALKIKYEIVVSKDMLHGDPLPDGNFTGMVGMVQREEVDLAMTHLVLTEIRSKAVNFSLPYYAERISFITAKPENSKQNLALFQVSDTPTWIGVGIVLIVMSVFFLRNLMVLCYSVTLLSHIIQPAKVAPIRTFHELSRAVQSGGHKVYTIQTYIPFLLDSKEDHLKELGKIVGHNNWIIPVQTYEETYVPSQTSRIPGSNHGSIKI